MATNRFGYSDDFVLKNGKVGINTAEPQEKLDVVGGIVKGQDLKVTGVSSFTTYEGFLEANHTIDESITLTSGTNSSLSGEIIVGTGVTVTIANVGLGTTTVGIGTNQTGTNTIDTDEIVSSGQGGIDSLKVYNTFTVPTGGTEDRPIKVKPGQLYYNKDFKTIEFWDGDRWRQVDNTTRSGRGVFAGMEDPARNTIDYIQTSTLGNAIEFGDLTDDGTQRERGGGCSSSTRGYSIGGRTPVVKNIIDYTTLASAGNAIDYGDLTTAAWYNAGCSSSTRGLSGGGRAPSTSNTIEYFELGTTGSGLDFGDLTVARERLAALSSTTRGIWGGGYNAGSGGPALTTQDSVTISSLGSAIDFGKLDRETDAFTGCANSVRGLWAGGTSKIAGASWNIISYITLASAGTAEYFGDLVGTGYNNCGSLASQTRGVFAGGGNPTVNTISYVQISSTGDSQDFGDLSVERRFILGWSDSHGGLGGF